MAAPTHETTERPRTAPATGGNGYAAPAAARGDAKSGKALAAMIVGIVSIPAAIIALVGLIAGLVAIVLGAVAKGEIRRTGMTNAGQATVGVVCGSIGLVLAIANMIAAGIAMS